MAGVAFWRRPKNPETTMARLGNEDALIANLVGKGEPTAPLKDLEKSLPLRVLSPADWDHWTSRGHVVVKDAVPPENLRRLVDLLWEFQEMDPGDPETWYRPQLRDNE